MKIITVCGMGFGTSLMMLMEIKKIAKECGYEIMGEACDVSSAKGQSCDLLVTSQELVNALENDKVPVISINNMLDKEELKAKIIPYVEKYFLEKN